ncbi:MAG: SIS domain-containing protein [Candidatus Dormibacteria bacterium]
MTEYAFDQQVAGQADAVAEALSRVDVPLLDRSRPLVFTGIGTSLHACQVAAHWVAALSRGRLRPAALEAHELALSGPLQGGDQLVVVSHRGTKRFPNVLLERARAVGATTVTVTGMGNLEVGGDFVLRTCPDERASTHTVSYLTALAVLGKLVARLLSDESSDFLGALLRSPEAISTTLALPPPLKAAARLAQRGPLLLTGYGIDEITAREAALKLKEGAYLFAEGMSQEFALHGTPAVFAPPMAAILIASDKDDGGRLPELRQLLLDLGLEVFTCGAGETDLPFSAVDHLLRPLVAILPLQRLVGELARIRHSNPDTTRGDQPPWSRAVPKVKL